MLVFSIFLILGIFIISFVSAGWFENIKARITGDVSQTVSLNISVGVPTIPQVYNNSIANLTILLNGPNEGPSSTSIIINFSAYSAAGADNLNDSTALMNITGSTTRTNASCKNFESAGNYKNYTCNITFFWWDATGTWAITAYVKDNSSNIAQNTTTNLYIGERTAFVMGPAALTWSGISPGAVNQTSNNDPLILNNTGNDVIDVGNIQINSSNLRGETDPTVGLWAANFSVDWNTGDTCTGAACLECAGTAMVRSAYTGVGIANLTADNYTQNNGNDGQEKLYFCSRIAGTELSTQAYSTANETEWAWIVQIV